MAMAGGISEHMLTSWSSSETVQNIFMQFYRNMYYM